jgi:hypothetical protein
MRLIYQGTAILGFSIDETALMPVGMLLDLMTVHRQYTGQETRKRYMPTEYLANL